MEDSDAFDFMIFTIEKGLDYLMRCGYRLISCGRISASWDAEIIGSLVRFRNNTI
jgi:hypothetical protein